MKVLDLFSGIGGFSLGLERAGMETIAFCEIEEFPRKVLKKHWPDVPIYKDVRKLHAEDLPEPVDVICGGFPCQDISLQGKGGGVECGERSGLWREYFRLIRQCKPRWITIENVKAITKRGLNIVLNDLATIGYDAEWNTYTALGFGLPHIRERIIIVAYPNSLNVQGGGKPNIHSKAWEIAEQQYLRLPDMDYWYTTAADWVGRKNDGLPNRSHRLKALGNAVVPQIPEIIGRAIMEVERTKQ